MIIRPFKSGDEKAIALIEKNCFSHPWSEAAILDEAASGSVFLVAEETDVIGYISCKLILGEGYINNIAVDSSHRKKGVAKALLSQLKHIAKQKGADFLTLEVRKSNLPAINLYSSFGYETVGERKDFYVDPTENALLLTLFLGDKNEDTCN